VELGAIIREFKIFMCVFYDFSRSPGWGEVAVDERLKASTVVACCVYSCTHVTRHKRLGNKIEVDSTGVRNKDIRRKDQETKERG
jgi:hypothetical protein